MYKDGNLNDFEFDLSMSLNFNSNDAVGLSIYNFLLMYNSNHMSISHCHSMKISPSFIISPTFWTNAGAGYNQMVGELNISFF